MRISNNLPSIVLPIMIGIGSGLTVDAALKYGNSAQYANSTSAVVEESDDSQRFNKGFSALCAIMCGGLAFGATRRLMASGSYDGDITTGGVNYQ
jgi:hypothetical protein